MLSVSSAALPRVLIAGLAGDTGKSLISLGAARALARRGLKVAPFKKGPDFIDAAWLGAATGEPGRNLDTFLMTEETILDQLCRAAQDFNVAIIEGNRGLFDGLDADGSHSTAQLSRVTGTPVVLVIDVTKTTRTTAALVKGCLALEPDLNLAGVVLNRVGTARQEGVIREAIANATGIPVIGAIPRLRAQHLPDRHLGLVTSMEHPHADAALEAVARAVEDNADLDALLDIAGESAASLPEVARQEHPGRPRVRARIGVLRDRAFSFYYPENLEALRDAGAELVEISPLADAQLPPVDGLYAGGGFPEVYAEELSANQVLREQLARSIGEGLPVWAECGGLMYLARALHKDGQSHPMVGALPIEVEHTARPQGHGYVEAHVDRETPFLEGGKRVRGHEFHYSRLRGDADGLTTALAVDRGVGIGGGRDGLCAGNVLASYTHLHASGTRSWARGLVAASAGGGTR